MEICGNYQKKTGRYTGPGLLTLTPPSHLPSCTGSPVAHCKIESSKTIWPFFALQVITKVLSRSPKNQEQSRRSLFRLLYIRYPVNRYHGTKWWWWRWWSMSSLGIKPGLHWSKASILATAPSLLPLFVESFKYKNWVWHQEFFSKLTQKSLKERFRWVSSPASRLRSGSWLRKCARRLSIEDSAIIAFNTTASIGDSWAS